MSDKNKERLFFCLLALDSILGIFSYNGNPIFFVLPCVSFAGVLIIGIPMIIKDVKAKKAAKQAAQDENEQ